MSKSKVKKSLLLQATFFEEYRIDKKKFDGSGLDWEKLLQIYTDYREFRKSLEDPATMIAAILRKMNKVHSIKLRIKDPEHLIAKIIRYEMTRVDQTNYKDVITDLIGLRALHLFKDDWLEIHKFIMDRWDPLKKPVANIRKGDPQQRTAEFIAAGCEPKEHDAGYRSIHYLIPFRPSKEQLTAEIQVRTIFEEGWSEIDHQFRYPNNLDNQVTNRFLIIFNSLAGSADEMGSFLKLLQQDQEGLKNKLDKKEMEHKAVLKKKAALINNLRTTVNRMNIEAGEKSGMMADLEDLSQLTSKDSSIGRSVDALVKQHQLARDIQMLTDAFSTSSEREDPV